MKLKRAALSALILMAILTSCTQGNESSFCDAAFEFNASVEKIDISDIASASGPEFWNSLTESVDELQKNSPELFQAQLQNLDVELEAFIAKLEENDFNLLLAALDPGTVESLIAFVESVLYAVNTEIAAFTDENC
jgi:hypothetical protein